MNVGSQRFIAILNVCPIRKTTIKKITPTIDFPIIAAIVLITWAITPVASPRASNLEYDSKSLSQLVVSYRL